MPQLVVMKCPSCSHVFETAVERCPNCKLSLQRLDMKFGIVPAHSRYLTDRSGKLPLDEMTQLRAELRLFQKKFPQSLCSIFITELPRDTSVAEYAFWLANRAKFSSGEKTGGENFNLLLVVDLVGNAAALTVGYGLEGHVSEQDLKSVLGDFANGMRDSGLAAGVHALIESLTRRLREISSQAASKKLQPAAA